MTKFTFRLLELLLKHLGSNLYFILEKCLTRSTVFLLLSSKDGCLHLMSVATLTAHEQGAHWSLPWIRHWTIHKHLHPSTITQKHLDYYYAHWNVHTILQPCRHEKLRGIYSMKTYEQRRHRTGTSCSHTSNIRTGAGSPSALVN